MNVQELISNEELEKVHGNSNFGPDLSKRDVVAYGVLKCASGYYQGATSRRICVDHGLIDEKTYELTSKGRAYLWASFCKGSNF
jgi:hypothetical protein